MSNGKGWTNRTLVRKTVQLEESDVNWIEQQAAGMEISSNEFIRRVISSFRILQEFTIFEALRPAADLEGVLWEKVEAMRKIASEQENED
jgi:hypothetical protein